MSTEEMTETIKNAVREALSENSSHSCKDKCGLTANEHYEAHKKINDFFSALGDMTKTFRKTIVSIVITAAVIAAAFGLGLDIKKFLP